MSRVVSFAFFFAIFLSTSALQAKFNTPSDQRWYERDLVGCFGDKPYACCNDGPKTESVIYKFQGDLCRWVCGDPKREVFFYKTVTLNPLPRNLAYIRRNCPEEGEQPEDDTIPGGLIGSGGAGGAAGGGTGAVTLPGHGQGPNGTTTSTNNRCVGLFSVTDVKAELDPTFIQEAAKPRQQGGRGLQLDDQYDFSPYSRIRVTAQVYRAQGYPANCPKQTSVTLSILGVNSQNSYYAVRANIPLARNPKLDGNSVSVGGTQAYSIIIDGFSEKPEQPFFGPVAQRNSELLASNKVLFEAKIPGEMYPKAIARGFNHCFRLFGSALGDEESQTSRELSLIFMRNENAKWSARDLINLGNFAGKNVFGPPLPTGVNIDPYTNQWARFAGYVDLLEHNGTVGHISDNTYDHDLIKSVSSCGSAGTGYFLGTGKIGVWGTSIINSRTMLLTAAYKNIIKPGSKTYFMGYETAGPALAKLTIAHEMGHGIGGLADEYLQYNRWGQGGPKNESANCTQVPSVWTHQGLNYAPSRVQGCSDFPEGDARAAALGGPVYRPSQRSIMNSLRVGSDSGLDDARFNVPACAAVMAGLDGKIINHTAAEWQPYLPQCWTMNVNR